MFGNLQFCPVNVTVSDFWLKYGISQCSLYTTISLVLACFVLVFGAIEMLVYRKLGAPIEDSLKLPASQLYQLQVLLLALISISPFVEITLNGYVTSDYEIYGYKILTSLLACTSMLFSIRLVVMERHYSLEIAATNGHGVVLLIFWVLVFINENVSMLAVKNREWCFYTLSDVIQLLWLVMRYVGSFSIVVLGVMAPGITSDQVKDYEKLDDEESKRHSNWPRAWKNIKRVVLRIWSKENVGVRIRIVFFLCTLIVQRGINFLVPVYNQKIVDSLGSKVFCWELILIFVGLRFLQGGDSLSSGVLSNLSHFLLSHIERFVTRETQCELFAHFHSLSLRWHLSRKTGEVLRILDNGPYSINTILQFFVFTLAPAVLDIIIAMLYFSATIDRYFALLFLISTIIYLGLTIFLTKWESKLEKQICDDENDRSSQSIDSLLNFETVKYYGAEKYEVDAYRKMILECEKTNSYQFGTSCIADFAKNIVICGSLLASSLMCAYLVVDKGELTPGQYVLFSTYIIELFTPIGDFGWYYGYIQRTLIQMEDMLNVLDEKPEVVDAPDATDLKLLHGTIKFSNVTFAYKSDNRDILKNISFTVPNGKTVAIVGPTGSGKSTIIRLLFRFYDVNDGSITIDGQNIASVKQDSLRRVIGVVPQDTVLFNDTIKYNIRYGRLDATDEEVIEAARAADIHDAIMNNFPDKYETEVGERGLKLSGGEKQRVAIARTILKAPRIVLLDEATSSLDTKTERNIQSALSKTCSNRTTIIVAHRLSTIIHADEILVLKDGEIVERGQHDTLLSENGIYADMWEQRFKNDGESADDGNPIAD